MSPDLSGCTSRDHDLSHSLQKHQPSVKTSKLTKVYLWPCTLIIGACWGCVGRGHQGPLDEAGARSLRRLLFRSAHAWSKIHANVAAAASCNPQMLHEPYVAHACNLQQPLRRARVCDSQHNNTEAPRHSNPQMSTIGVKIKYPFLSGWTIRYQSRVKQCGGPSLAAA